MERTRRWDRRVLLLAAAVAVLLASVGMATATIPGSGGLISGCYKRTGVLRVVDSAAARCNATETPLSWNQSGPQGLAGATGPDGADGAAGLRRVRQHRLTFRQAGSAAAGPACGGGGARPAPSRRTPRGGGARAAGSRPPPAGVPPPPGGGQAAGGGA